MPCCWLCGACLPCLFDCALQNHVFDCFAVSACVRDPKCSRPGVALPEPLARRHLCLESRRAPRRLHRLCKVVAFTLRNACFTRRDVLPTGPLPMNTIMLSRAGFLNSRMAGGCSVWMYDSMASELRCVYVRLCV